MHSEYCRTIDMLIAMTHSSKETIMRVLYFLHDSQYGNADLKDMADLILEKTYN